MRKDMNNLILVTPTKEHESQVMEFREEMLKNGEGFYGCSGLNSVSGYDKGYARQMLLLVLRKAENFGYKKVLVCCNKANAQSASVIQKCGGVLENEVVHEFSPPNRPDIIQRYWIETGWS